MSKGTRAEHLEKLLDANKKLRAQVRQLRKELKAADSERELLTDLWAEEIAEIKKQRRLRKKVKETPVCPECGNPTLYITQAGVWTLERCEVCDYFNREEKK